MVRPRGRSVEADVQSLKPIIDRDINTIQRVVVSVVTRTTNDLKKARRAHVRSRLSSRKAPTTISSRIFKDGPADVTGFLFSRWTIRDSRGRLVDPLAVLNRGATIRATRGFMVIPAPGRTRIDARRSTRLAFDGQGRFDVVPQRRGYAVIKRVSRKRTTLIAFLRRRVDIPDKLDLDQIDREFSTELPQRLLDRLSRLERGG